tara:strand:+ start:144 stop:467 length:324 start_codon:yes stop_codon:yes gene_type:complete
MLSLSIKKYMKKLKIWMLGVVSYYILSFLLYILMSNVISKDSLAVLLVFLIPGPLLFYIFIELRSWFYEIKSLSQEDIKGYIYSKLVWLILLAALSFVVMFFNELVS